MTGYIALAPRREVVVDWVRRWGIRPTQVRTVMDMREVRGQSDFNVILFGNWSRPDLPKHENMRRRDLGEFVMRRALTVRFAERYDPVVVRSLITEWRKKEEKVG